MESSRHLSGSYKVSITGRSLALNKFSNRRLKYLIWPCELFPGLWENISPASQHHRAAVSLGITLPVEGPGLCSVLPRPRADRWGHLLLSPAARQAVWGAVWIWAIGWMEGVSRRKWGRLSQPRPTPRGPRADPMPVGATTLLLFISSPLGGPLAASSSSVSSGVVLRPSCPVESPREFADTSPLPVRPGSLGGPGGSGFRSTAGTAPSALSWAPGLSFSLRSPSSTAWPPALPTPSPPAFSLRLLGAAPRALWSYSSEKCGGSIWSFYRPLPKSGWTHGSHESIGDREPLFPKTWISLFVFQIKII